MAARPTTQKTLSPWTAVAAAQCWFWAFALPPLCRGFWGSFFGSLTNETAELVLNQFPVVFLVCYSLVMLPVYWCQHPFFERHKILRGKPWPWRDENEAVRRGFWKLTRRSVGIVGWNLLVILPTMSYAKIKAVSWLGWGGPDFRTDDGAWPTPLESLRNVVAMTIVHEFGFYATHRMMHAVPWLYQFHKVHHEYKSNTVLAAIHNHPVDFLLSVGGPAFVPIIWVQPHSITVLQWTIWLMWANLDDHTGYEFPWSPVRWFPLAALTDEHEFHHAKNLGCFGSKLTLYNHLFGGYEHYRPWVQKSKYL